MAADFSAMRLADMDAGFGGHFLRARASLGASAFGLSVLELPANFQGYPEHAHDRDHQEEVYVALRGSATILIDGEQVTLDPETFVRVGRSCRRKILPGPEGVRLLVIGGRPGHAYAAPEFSEVGAADDARRAGPDAG